jgi:hypothetical protein
MFIQPICHSYPHHLGYGGGTGLYIGSGSYSGGNEGYYESPNMTWTEFMYATFWMFFTLITTNIIL